MEGVYGYFPCLQPRTAFLAKTPGRRCLDVGCGDGVVIRQNLAVRPDLQITGIDIYDVGSGFPSEAGFVRYDGYNLPFASASFDLGAMNHVLEHVPDPVRLLREIRRVLVPGGMFYIETPGPRSLFPRSSRRFAGTVAFSDDPTHLKPYSWDELADIGKSTGFRFIEGGKVRNLLHLMFSPALGLCGMLRPEKLWYMYARNALLGWAEWVVLERPR